MGNGDISYYLFIKNAHLETITADMEYAHDFKSKEAAHAYIEKRNGPKYLAYKVQFKLEFTRLYKPRQN